MKDAYTNWRNGPTAGNLTATETSAGVDLGAAPVNGHPVAIHVPAQNASGDTLDITFTESATLTGTYREFAKVRPQITGTGTAKAPINPKTRLFNTQRFVKCVLTVAGSTPNWGAVHVGMDQGVFQNELQTGATNP